LRPGPGSLEIDENAGVINGRAVNAHAILTFEGGTVKELRAAFADTITDWRDWCRERGVADRLAEVT
jgi:predicted HicB family RNase H-like nuclease